MVTVSFVLMASVPMPLQTDPKLELLVNKTVRPITWVHPLTLEEPVNSISDAGIYTEPCIVAETPSIFWVLAPAVVRLPKMRIPEKDGPLVGADRFRVPLPFSLR